MLLRALHAAIAILMGIMTVVVFTQVVVRYFTSAAVPWAQELARFAMVWMVFLGAIAAAVSKQHIEVDAVVRLFRGKARRLLDLVRYILILGFCTLVVLGSSEILRLTFRQLSPTLGWKMGWIYSAIPFSMAVLGILVFIEAIKNFRGR